LVIGLEIEIFFKILCSRHKFSSEKVEAPPPDVYPTGAGTASITALHVEMKHHSGEENEGNIFFQRNFA